jgi:hypothetical protein
MSGVVPGMITFAYHGNQFHVARIVRQVRRVELMGSNQPVETEQRPPLISSKIRRYCRHSAP